MVTTHIAGCSKLTLLTIAQITLVANLNFVSYRVIWVMKFFNVMLKSVNKVVYLYTESGDCEQRSNADRDPTGS
jgi:hypothetical protein